MIILDVKGGILDVLIFSTIACMTLVSGIAGIGTSQRQKLPMNLVTDIRVFHACQGISIEFEIGFVG